MKVFGESQLKFLLKERNLVKCILVDDIFLSKRKELRSYVLNSLEFVLNKGKTTRNKIFSAVYY